METQVIDLTTNPSSGAGTQILSSGSTTETSANFTGGLLQIHENVAGWEVTSKLGTLSGEADIYVAQKDGQKGVVKYYRSTTKPKTEILEKLKQLNHPDIVNIFDFGVYNDRFYEIMEYADGGALDTRNADGSYRYLPLPEEKVEGICKEVINSFKTCHEKNIIHRDIKPANIYYRTLETKEIEEGGEKKTVYRGNDVVIADFGISSIMDETEELHKTRTGSRTTGYAAPEVLSGIISPKMDYYALGITLWELLTGKDPFTLDNGKRRNDAHLIRDTIEGRIADDILSKEPRVSQKMERLIRGLLVIDHEHRWGYDEVTRHLAGEKVEINQKKKEKWSFAIGDVECTTLEALGSAIIEKPEDAKKYIFKGLLAARLEEHYPDISKQIVQIAEESSANNDHDNGILKIAYLLNPALPLKIANGFKMQNLDDLIFLLDSAPESVIPQLRNEKSKLYTWLEITGYKDIAKEIKKLPGVFSGGMGNTELAGKATVLLKRKVIKPFKLAKYADFELSTLEQIRKVPKDMQARILTLVKEKSYEGLFLPWFELLAPKTGTSALITEYFDLPASAAKPARSAGEKPSSQINAQISTYSACEIDEKQSQIKKDQVVPHGDNSSYSVELSIKTASVIPDNAAEFWYFIRTKTAANKQDPWVEAKDLSAATDMRKITINDYKKRGEILFTTTVKDENSFYVTMFTVFNINGKQVVSLPAKKRLDRTLNANVFWKVTKPIIGNKRLSIEIKPNRSITLLPEFVLCASLQGQHLGNYKDENAKILIEIQEQELASPQTIIKKEYEIVSPVSSQLTKNSKLYLFVTSSAQNECYSLRWAEGFTGKI